MRRARSSSWLDSSPAIPTRNEPYLEGTKKCESPWHEPRAFALLVERTDQSTLPLKPALRRVSTTLALSKSLPLIFTSFLAGNSTFSSLKRVVMARLHELQQTCTFLTATSSAFSLLGA